MSGQLRTVLISAEVPEGRAGYARELWTEGGDETLRELTGGGPLEELHLHTTADGSAVVMVLHEEGKLIGLPFNPAATQLAQTLIEGFADTIHGQVLVVLVGPGGELETMPDALGMVMANLAHGVDPDEVGINVEESLLQRERPLHDGDLDALWQAPPPERLADLRLAMISQLSRPYELERQAYEQLLIHAGTLEAEPAVEFAAQLVDSEARRLAEARLFYAAPDKTELARQAATSMPWGPIEEWEMPAPSGFILFAHPVTGYMLQQNGVDIPMAAVGVVWGLAAVEGKPGVWLSCWSVTDREALRAAFVARGEDADAAEQRAREHSPSGLSWDCNVTFVLGETGPDGRPAAPAGRQINDQIWGWVRPTLATWLMMRQEQLTETEEVAQPRAARRRAARGPVPVDERPVTVVRLRSRPKRTARPGTGKPWDYRCIVPTHWRTYLMGKGRTRRERKLITRYIAGPEDAPLKVGNTVNLWEGD